MSFTSARRGVASHPCQSLVWRSAARGLFKPFAIHGCIAWHLFCNENYLARAAIRGYFGRHHGQEPGIVLDTALASSTAQLGAPLDAQALDELAPASYCTALLCLRYAATLPWKVAGSGLLPEEARQLTLHSMKKHALGRCSPASPG